MSFPFRLSCVCLKGRKKNKRSQGYALCKQTNSHAKQKGKPLCIVQTDKRSYKIERKTVMLCAHRQKFLRNRKESRFKFEDAWWGMAACGAKTADRIYAMFGRQEGEERDGGVLLPHVWMV